MAGPGAEDLLKMVDLKHEEFNAAANAFIPLKGFFSTYSAQDMITALWEHLERTYTEKELLFIKLDDNIWQFKFSI